MIWHGYGLMIFSWARNWGKITFCLRVCYWGVWFFSQWYFILLSNVIYHLISFEHIWYTFWKIYYISYIEIRILMFSRYQAYIMYQWQILCNTTAFSFNRLLTSEFLECLNLMIGYTSYTGRANYRQKPSSNQPFQSTDISGIFIFWTIFSAILVHSSIWL